MSSEVGNIEVIFEDDHARQEIFLYSGQTTMAPFPQALNNWHLSGTPFKFSATVGRTVTLPNSLEVKENFQTITAMKLYSGKSVEELRFEDYGLKRPSQKLQIEHCKFKKTVRSSRPRAGGSLGFDVGFATTSSSGLFSASEMPVYSFQVPTTSCPGSSGSRVSGFPQRRGEPPVAMSTDCSPDESETLFSSTSYSFIPNFNFSLESDPLRVFTPLQPQAADKTPLSALSLSEGQSLKDALLISIGKCMQLQNSLYRLVLLKLQSFIRSQTNADLDHKRALNVCKDSSTGDTRVRDGQNTGPGVLLNGLKEPLNALMRCADIQRSLYQRLVTMNLITNETTQQSAVTAEVQDNLMIVQSELEGIAFENKLECSYARNPFTSIRHRASTSNDVLHHASWKCTQVPHGYGSLKTLKGKLVYSGQWRKGKRHGKGEGFIFAVDSNLSTPNYSAAGHGFYTGGWKHNMRHGHGQMTFSSGAVFEGQWQFDGMTGFGTLKLPDGSIQEGTWRDGSLQGCALFTWPHGVTEYREYDASRGQLSSCKIEKEFAEELPQISCIRSQLLKLREQVSQLKEERSALSDQLNAQKIEQAEARREIMASLTRLKANYIAQRKKDHQLQRDEYEQQLKEAAECESKSADRIRELEKQLEESSNAQLCQICFDHPRDCIIMPCTHLLYCRACVAEHKRKGDNRCPTCRGPICGEILCNISHSS